MQDFPDVDELLDTTDTVVMEKAHADDDAPDVEDEESAQRVRLA